MRLGQVALAGGAGGGQVVQDREAPRVTADDAAAWNPRFTDDERHEEVVLDALGLSSLWLMGR